MPERKQPFLIRAHEVHHRLVADLMPVKPNAAAEGETHPLAAASELPVRCVYVQVSLPATVAVPTGAAAPLKR